MKCYKTTSRRIVNGAIALLVCANLSNPVRADALAAWLACIADAQTSYADDMIDCACTESAANDPAEITLNDCKADCDEDKVTGDENCEAARDAAEAAAEAQYAIGLAQCTSNWLTAYADAAALTDPATQQAIRDAADAALPICNTGKGTIRNAAYVAATTNYYSSKALIENELETCYEVCDMPYVAVLEASAAAFTLCEAFADVAKANRVIACGPFPGT